MSYSPFVRHRMCRRGNNPSLLVRAAAGTYLIGRAKLLSQRCSGPDDSGEAGSRYSDTIPRSRGSVMARPSRRTAMLVGTGATVACLAASAAVVWQAADSPVSPTPTQPARHLGAGSGGLSDQHPNTP